jgi:hypothetical protein
VTLEHGLRELREVVRCRSDGHAANSMLAPCQKP